MAKRTKRSGLLGKNADRLRRAHEEHKGDDTSFGAGEDLPAGINGGVAKLVDCKFDVYARGDNEGEYYFYAAGVVVQPTIHEGVNIEGLRTSIMEPMCDTPNRSRETVEEHHSWVLNEIRKLGIATDEIGIDDLEATAKALKESGLHFRFRTWQGEATEQYPNPRVNHQWRGICEYEEEEDGGMAEATKGKEPEPEDTNTEDDVPFEDETNEALADKADGGDEEAQEELAKRAREVGVDPDKPANWRDVATAIAETSEDPADAGDKDSEPVKGETYLYKPPKKRKEVKCEVTAVFAGKETCNLQNLDTKQGYKSVPWGKLVDVE